MQNVWGTSRFNKVNTGVIDDFFENFVVSAEEFKLETLREKRTFKREFSNCKCPMPERRNAKGASPIIKYCILLLFKIHYPCPVSLKIAIH